MSVNLILQSVPVLDLRQESNKLRGLWENVDIFLLHGFRHSGCGFLFFGTIRRPDAQCGRLNTVGTRDRSHFLNTALTCSLLWEVRWWVLA
jgi:hypothetical protein